MAKKGKKGAGEEKKIRLGRPSNNVEIGIVGMPNIGKSSLFNLLSKLSVPAENFPFCTIDPSTAKVPVPDERFDFLCKAHKPAKEIPAVLTVTDIAGLVKGASEGKGLGNAFLSHITAVDAIFHVCRGFKDKKIEHVEDSVDATRDLDIINGELIAKDIAHVKTSLEAVEKIVKRGIDKMKGKELDTLQRVHAWLEEGKDVREGQWSNDDVEVLNTLNLLSAKPIVYLCNIGNKDFEKQKNKWLGAVIAYAKERSPGSPVIPFSATFEQGLLDMGEEEAAKYLEEKKLPSMVPRIIKAGYAALDLIRFFTSGPDEVRAWTIRDGTLAPGAAGTIHGELEQGFVCAEVMSYEDWKECGSDQEAKKQGKNRQQGKNYVVQDGDIMFVKANGGKKR